jgi:ParB family chromosome partitioning protein
MNTTPTTTPVPAGLEGIPLDFADHLEQGSITKGMAGATKGILWKATRDQLHVMPGLNVRADTPEYKAHVSRIARSMNAEGWHDDKPLAVFIDKDNRACVKDGHSRLKAYDEAIAMGAQIAYIPVIASTEYNMADITAGLVKSNEGRPLQPIEKAVVCRRLRGWGWEVQKIADKLDFSVAYVNELLALLAAPPALVALVEAGKVSASTAVDAIKSMGATEAAAVIVEASKKSKKAGKVVASDIGQSKAQKAVRAAAKKAPPKVPKDIPAGDPLKVLRAVYDDEAFKELADKVQVQIIAILNP